MDITRRSAIHRTAALGLASAFTSALSPSASLRAANVATRNLRVAVWGLGRGMSHVSALLGQADVDIVWLAEVDPERLAKGLKAVSNKQATPCEGVKDFRKCLDDRNLDAVFIALPNFWYTPASMFTSKSPVAKIHTRRNSSSQERENTRVSFRWAISVARGCAREFRLCTAV